MSEKPRRRLVRQFPNVYARRQRSGNWSYVVDLGLVDGVRKRHSFKSREEANSFAEQARVRRRNEGASAFNISLALGQDALKAAALLHPHHCTLLEAARYYVKHVVAYRSAPPVRDIVKRMLEEAAANQRRKSTQADLKSRLEHFAETFGDSRPGEIDLEDLKDWVAEHEWAPQSKINHLTKVSQLFNYAVRHGWAERNLVDSIDRPEPEDREPGIFTVEQAERLLRHAAEEDLLAYIALGLFAGLRAAELQRLDWSAVRLEDRAIIVSGQVAKKRSRRVVEMRDNLRSWLTPLARPEGPLVSPVRFRERLEALRVRAEIPSWPHNGLRHSFGSYHLALTGDANQTANQMGHRDSLVVHNHYKALVLKPEAEKYWALVPGTS